MLAKRLPLPKSSASFSEISQRNDKILYKLIRKRKETQFERKRVSNTKSKSQSALKNLFNKPKIESQNSNKEISNIFTPPSTLNCDKPKMKIWLTKGKRLSLSSNSSCENTLVLKKSKYRYSVKQSNDYEDINLKRKRSIQEEAKELGGIYGHQMKRFKH
ncbi:unnamed protein product [Blepharisma stoltei]|uniref:Uncharacterized protein n=1 Tax=Blepharisma stoltei TaxID=1481888 RepID=A0AAU9J821_9CILI|nr:unnamed protein product [Blepharisma stoltei]